MGGVSIGCVSIEGVVFYNRTNTYLVVLTVVVCIGLVASCCFLSLHPTFMMHGHKNLKLKKKIVSKIVVHVPLLVCQSLVIGM